MIRGQQARWTLAGIAIGVLFLLIAGRGLDYAEVLAVLATIKVHEAALATLATLGFMALKTLRWELILRPGIVAHFGFLHRVTYVGSAANLMIVHSGELVRAMTVGRRCGVASSAVLASVGIERVFDMLTVLTFLGLLVFVGAEMTHSLTVAAAVAAGLAMVALILMFGLLRPSPIRQALARTALIVLPAPLGTWLSRQVQRGLLGLAALSNPLTLLRTFVLSIVQWSCIIAGIWLTVRAVGHEVTVPAAIGVWVLMVLGLTLPSSPAQLGTTQLAYMLGLSLTETNDEVAFAASVVYVCTVNLPIMVVGAVSWLMATGSEREARSTGAQSRADAS